MAFGLVVRSRGLGGNLMAGLRFDSSGLGGTMSEIVAYGTAVGVASDAAASDATHEPRVRPADEVFMDPTSGRKMRVWLDSRSGERR